MAISDKDVVGKLSHATANRNIGANANSESGVGVSCCDGAAEHNTGEVECAYDGITVVSPTTAEGIDRIARCTDELLAIESEPVNEEEIRRHISESSKTLEPLPPIRNVVLAGAGGRGFIYCGVALSLDKHGVLETLKRVFGTSCGAIIGTAIALGYRGQDIIDILVNTDFGDFKSELPKSTLERIITSLTGEAIGNALSILLYRRGLYSGEGALNWLEFMVYAATGDPHTTFAQLQEMGKTNIAIKELYIIAANLTDGTEQVFSYKTTPNVRIAIAVLGSMSLPGAFIPVEIEIDSEIKHIVDGGAVDEFPMSMTDVLEFADPEYGLNPNGANPSTLGFRLDQAGRIEDIFHSHTRVSAGEYDASVRAWMDRLRLAATQAGQDRETYTKHSMTTVGIDDMGASTFDFSVTPRRKLDMAKHGCRKTDEHFYLYRGCGTFYRSERRGSRRLERQIDATANELIDEYNKVTKQYVEDKSIDIVRQEYLLQRLKEILYLLELKFSTNPLISELKDRQSNLGVLQAEHREIFETAREGMVEHRRAIRIRMDTYISADENLSPGVLDIIKRDAKVELLFACSRKNHWSSQDKVLALHDKVSVEHNNGNIAYVAAAEDATTVFIFLQECFGREYVSGPGKNGLTPLSVAITNNNKYIISACAFYMPELVKQGQEKYSPLMHAVNEGRLDVACYLLEHFPDKISPESVMETLMDNESNILHEIFKKGIFEVNDILKMIEAICKYNPEHFADMLRAKDSLNNTPIHYLAQCGGIEILATLVHFISKYELITESRSTKYLLSINVKGSNEETVLDKAKLNNDLSDAHHVFHLRIKDISGEEYDWLSQTRINTLTRSASASDVCLLTAHSDEYEQALGQETERDLLLNTSPRDKILVRRASMDI